MQCNATAIHVYMYTYTSSYYSPSVLPGTLVQSRSVLWLGNKENLRRPSPLFTSSKVLDAWTGNPRRVWFKGPHLKNIFESDESVTIEFCPFCLLHVAMLLCHFEVSTFEQCPSGGDSAGETQRDPEGNFAPLALAFTVGSPSSPFAAANCPWSRPYNDGIRMYL